MDTELRLDRKLTPVFRKVIQTFQKLSTKDYNSRSTGKTERYKHMEIESLNYFVANTNNNGIRMFSRLPLNITNNYNNQSRRIISS